jgi:hypothetical protein
MLRSLVPYPSGRPGLQTGQQSLLRIFLRWALLACMMAWSLAAIAKEAVPPLREIYLYRSPATNAFFRAHDSDYNKLLDQWRIYLKKYDAHFHEVRKKDLMSDLKPGVLILASTLLLGDDERAAINAFTRRGGSVLASWGTGSRDARGQWLGYRFIEQTFSLTITGEIDRSSERWFMMPYGDGPLTWPMPAGRRVYMGITAENLLRIDSPRLAARFMDWDRTADPEKADGAIAYTEQDGSRRVYLGFAESAWDFHKRDEITRMLDAMMSWLRREPHIWLAAWPDGKGAAGLLEMDTEDRFANAATFARQLEKNGLRGTFYCVTSEAIKYPQLVRDLKQRGHEIAYHADVHIGFEGQPRQQQEDRLHNMLEQMARVLGPDLSSQTGFRAPTESYDKTTEILLRKYGMRHHAADPSSTEDRLPFFSESEPGRSINDALIVLPRTHFDDISFRVRNFDEDKTRQHLLLDFNQSLEMGGLGLLSVHSQNYGPDGSMTTTMPFLFTRIAEVRDRIWIERADTITAWWRNRARVRVNIRNEDGGSGGNNSGGSRGRIIDLHIRPPGAVTGLSLMVTHVETGGVTAQVMALSPRAPAARIVPVDEFRYAIVLDKAAPGAHRYLVRF